MPKVLEVPKVPVAFGGSFLTPINELRAAQTTTLGTLDHFKYFRHSKTKHPVRSKLLLARISSTVTGPRFDFTGTRLIQFQIVEKIKISGNRAPKGARFVPDSENRHYIALISGEGTQGDSAKQR